MAARGIDAGRFGVIMAVGGGQKPLIRGGGVECWGRDFFSDIKWKKDCCRFVFRLRLFLLLLLFLFLFVGDAAAGGADVCPFVGWGK